MVGTYKSLAQKIKEQKIPLVVEAINMSIGLDEVNKSLNLDGFPEIRLYSGPKKYKLFEGRRNMKGLSDFLVQNGFKLKEAEPAALVEVGDINI